MDSFTAQFYKGLDFIADNLEYFLAVTIPMTLIVLLISTKYAMDNIFTIWKKGTPAPVEEHEVSDAEEGDDVIVNSGDVNWSPRDVTVGDNGPTGDAGPDPLQYCEHIQSEVKKARQRVATREIQGKLTKDDVENEREIQRKQLQDIFRMMEQQQEKFGVGSVDDIQQQMKLYA